MLQICSGLDFLQEPLGAEDRCEFGTEDFDGDLAFVLEIVREVDGSHAACTEFALDGVAVGEGGRELGEGVGHG